MVLLRRAIRAVERLVAFAAQQPSHDDTLLQAIGAATIARTKAYELLRGVKSESLIGTTIIDVRNIDRSAVHQLSWYEAWHDVPLLLELDNELRIVPSRDHALNGPGVFTVIDERQQVFTLTSVTPASDEQ